jgi:hypothetical protein
MAIFSLIGLAGAALFGGPSVKLVEKQGERK